MEHLLTLDNDVRWQLYQLLAAGDTYEIAVETDDDGTVCSVGIDRRKEGELTSLKLWSI